MNWPVDQLTVLPRSDIDHLVGDINRVYGLLIGQWFVYLQHVKGQYPYLYSLAVRKNPFDEDATPVVKDVVFDEGAGPSGEETEEKEKQ